MKQSLSAFAVVLILAGGVELAGQQQAPPPAQEAPKVPPDKPTGFAGKWVLNLETPQGATKLSLEVKVDAQNKVTGTLVGPQGPAQIQGEVREGVLGFTFGYGVAISLDLYVEAKVDAEDKMTGTMSIGDMGKYTFTGVRAKA